MDLTRWLGLDGLANEPQAQCSVHDIVEPADHLVPCVAVEKHVVHMDPYQQGRAAVVGDEHAALAELWIEPGAAQQMIKPRMPLKQRAMFPNETKEPSSIASRRPRGVGRPHRKPAVPIVVPGRGVHHAHILPLGRFRVEHVEELGGIDYGREASPIEAGEDILRLRQVDGVSHTHLILTAIFHVGDASPLSWLSRLGYQEERTVVEDGRARWDPFIDPQRDEFFDKLVGDGQLLLRHITVGEQTRFGRLHEVH